MLEWLKKNNSFFTKKDGWTMQLHSLEAKKRRLELQELLENAHLCSINLLSRCSLLALNTNNLKYLITIKFDNMSTMINNN